MATGGGEDASNLLAMDVDVEEGEKSDSLQEQFDVLPLFVNVLQDILNSTASTDEAALKTRLGDVSVQATALKTKYQDNATLLRSLPGIDRSIEQQLQEIAKMKHTLVRKQQLVAEYKQTLFREEI